MIPVNFEYVDEFIAPLRYPELVDPFPSFASIIKAGADLTDDQDTRRFIRQVIVPGYNQLSPESQEKMKYSLHFYLVHPINPRTRCNYFEEAFPWWIEPEKLFQKICRYYFPARTTPSNLPRSTRKMSRWSLRRLMPDQGYPLSEAQVVWCSPTRTARTACGWARAAPGLWRQCSGAKNSLTRCSDISTEDSKVFEQNGVMGTT